jgi:hypothetical protein
MNVVDDMERQISATQLPAGSRLTRSRALLAGAVTGLAAIAAVLTLTLTAANPTPAYAVTVHQNRTATVTLRNYSSMGALNRRMEALGLPIRAVPVVRGCHAKADVVGRTRRPDGPTTLTMNPRNGRIVSFTVNIPRAGRTLILGASKGGFYTHGDVIRGMVPSCVGVNSQPLLIFEHH